MHLQLRMQSDSAWHAISRPAVSVISYLPTCLCMHIRTLLLAPTTMCACDSLASRATGYPPYHMTGDTMASSATLSMLFRICWLRVALLWLHPDGALTQSTGRQCLTLSRVYNKLTSCCVPELVLTRQMIIISGASLSKE